MLKEPIKLLVTDSSTIHSLIVSFYYAVQATLEKIAYHNLVSVTIDEGVGNSKFF